jgi:hypothetical protein
MNYLKLTIKDGLPFLVNIHQINAICPDPQNLQSKTQISLQEIVYTVDQRFEEVTLLLLKARAEIT